MEILLVDNQKMSLVAANVSNSEKLDLDVQQQKSIMSTIKRKCKNCSICTGVIRVNQRGHIYSGMTTPVPSNCPAEGETITV